jgi:hypothetical protein
MYASTALSTVVSTPFGRTLTTQKRFAIEEAQVVADMNQCPCGVWERDGWFTVCELAPDEIEPSPEWSGWVLWAIVDPQD